MTDNRFPKRVRLLRASDFEKVFAARASAADAWITMYGAANELGHARIGLTVSRRVGNAVARNRWKRLLREAFRQSQHRLPLLDIVCVAKTQEPPTLSQLMTTIPALALRIESKLNGATRRSGSGT